MRPRRLPCTTPLIKKTSKVPADIRPGLATRRKQLRGSRCLWTLRLMVYKCHATPWLSEAGFKPTSWGVNACGPGVASVHTAGHTGLVAVASTIKALVMILLRQRANCCSCGGAKDARHRTARRRSCCANPHSPRQECRRQPFPYLNRAGVPCVDSTRTENCRLLLSPLGFRQ